MKRNHLEPRGRSAVVRAFGVSCCVALGCVAMLLMVRPAEATSPFCGDGIRGTDFCDGTEFPPGFTDDCATWGLDSGSVTCTAACVPDFSGCTTTDYCQASGFYGDGLCDSCELWGGIPDPDCQQCFNADGQCIEYLIGVWTCQQSAGAADPDCSCGDGIAQSVEPCDGADLKGNSCQSWGYTGGGSLACLPNCDVDFSGCLIAPPVPSGQPFGLLLATMAILLAGMAVLRIRAHSGDRA